MRPNKYIAEATGSSRRQADNLITANRIRVNGIAPVLGAQVSEDDMVTLDGNIIQPMAYQYLLVNKPVGYVCSRAHQDDKPTIYELLPDDLQHLKTAGRLDADSRGLILLTNDGDYANQLMHPSFAKTKLYELQLDKELGENDERLLNQGVELEDGVSALKVIKHNPLTVEMHEGRNRQIRRTFDALGYSVTDLRRISFGPYSLAGIEEGGYAASSKKAL